MIQVKLMGELGQLFGADWTSGDKDLRSVLQLIECQSNGFAEKLKEYVDKGIGLEILHGKDLFLSKEEDLPKVLLPMIKDTIFITPMPTGSAKKKRGFGRLVAAFVLFIVAPQLAGFSQTTTMVGAETVTKLTVGSYTAQYAYQAAAYLLAYAGVMDYLALDEPSKSPDSYLFGNSAETIKQGNAVPLAYGEVLIPGLPINVAFLPDKIADVIFYSGDLTGGGIAAAGAAGDKSSRVSEGTSIVSAEVK